MQITVKLIYIFCHLNVIFCNPLPKLNVDMESITVSGVSSGGYMAVQMHVAFSRLIKGAGN